MIRIANPREITATHLRAAMLGRQADGIQVIRQSWRTSDADSDELALINARGSWWVARRLSDHLTVWAFQGDVEAEACYEQLLEVDRFAGQPWYEAAPALLAG